MKIVQINTVFKRGSTGKIAAEIQQESQKRGHENIVAFRYKEDEMASNTYCISSWLDCHIHNRLARYTHMSGFYSKYKTWKFLRYVEKLHPDIIHLHNLHGSYVNIRKIFEYITTHKVKTIWTFHDCWPFTGYCPYFEIANCEEWRDGCKQCVYETSVWNKNHAAYCWKRKKESTENIDLTIVVPSRWMAQLVKESFYSKFDIRVITNGIDLSVFQPIDSDFRKNHNVVAKYMLLGVATVWNERKGIDVLCELSTKMNSDNYQIVLVGDVEREIKEKYKSIVYIEHVKDQRQLAEIYSAADLFINPTREETLGLVNIEAIACGTPVVTFNTGGSPECIDNTCGCVIEKDDVDAMEKEIVRICTEVPYESEACLKYARNFDKNIKFQEYIDLYEEIVK